MEPGAHPTRQSGAQPAQTPKTPTSTHALQVVELELGELRPVPRQGRRSDGRGQGEPGGLDARPAPFAEQSRTCEYLACTAGSGRPGVGGHAHRGGAAGLSPLFSTHVNPYLDTSKNLGADQHRRSSPDPAAWDGRRAIACGPGVRLPRSGSRRSSPSGVGCRAPAVPTNSTRLAPSGSALRRLRRARGLVGCSARPPTADAPREGGSA